MSPTSHDPRDPIARIERLVDDGKFEFLVPRTECGMLAVTGSVKGCKVVIFASDATIKSGALGIDGSKVIVTAYKAAMGAQLPIIGIWHSGGARLSDGVASLDAFGEVFQSMISASGRIPQLSLVLGPTAGGGAYGPALTDVVVLAPEGRIFVTGPDVVKSVTGDVVDMALLGGPEAHSKNSGVAHVIAPTEEIAYREIQDLVSLFANQGLMATDIADVPLAHLVPDTAQRIYEVHPLVDAILDSDPDVGATTGPTSMVVNGEASHVLLTIDSLGDDDPALAANPHLPAVFVFNEQALRKLQLSARRIAFYLQTLADLNTRRPVAVYLGDPYQFAQDNAVAVTYAPVPSFKKFGKLAEVHPYPWLRPPHAGTVKSYSSWRKKLSHDE